MMKGGAAKAGVSDKEFNAAKKRVAVA